MSVVRPGGASGNRASIRETRENRNSSIVNSSGRYAKQRRPEFHGIRDEHYQLGAHGTTIRSSGATAAYQRP